MHRVTPTTTKIAATETDKIGWPTHVWALALDRGAENLDYWSRVMACSPCDILGSRGQRTHAASALTW